MATKKLYSSILAELAKRVPPDQIKQFKEFGDKTQKYQRRVYQYPDQLPNIDWEYYRNNVRKDYVKMVEQFQVKYEELSHAFTSRHEILDHTIYYKDLEKLYEQVENEVNRYVEESNNRVKIYQDEIKRIESLAYENMTLEEFIEKREDVANLIPRKGMDLFWPHNAEEQLEAEDKVKDKEVEVKPKGQEKDK
ncbi:knotted onions [Cochliomyia hominivorax]